MKILLKNINAILPEQRVENISILIENGKIADIGAAKNNAAKADEIFDASNSNLTLYAGFIDVHNHGAVGVDVNRARAGDLQKVSEFLANRGVTAWVPTLVPDTNENYAKTIKAIDELMERQNSEPIAQILGVHYEGVFANEKMCGALRPEYFRTFRNGDEIESLPKLKRGMHFMTLAPEIENGIALINELVKRNWTISIGHSKADLPTLDKAFAAGAKHLTHFFNAMTGLHHRDVGVVGWGLTKEEITFDIIADGIHVDPKMLKFGVTSKGAENVSLISDSVAPTGLGDGDFDLWNEKISIVAGKTRNRRGNLAGSVITLLDAVKLMLWLGFSATEVSQMASANPARLLRVEKTRGSIEIGKRADLAALDKNGDVKLCLVRGKVCFNEI